MDASTRDAITWTLCTIIAVFAILGVIVRLVLVPYLREHLITPVKQVEKQVTENHHSNETPTVLDRIDDVQTAIKALAHAFDGHLDWSESWTKLIEREIDLVRRERGTPPT